MRWCVVPTAKAIESLGRASKGPTYHVAEHAGLGGSLLVRPDELAHDLLALTDDHEVHKRGHRLGIREGADATHHDERIAGASRRRPPGDPGQVEQPKHVDVIALVSDGEAYEMDP